MAKAAGTTRALSNAAKHKNAAKTKQGRNRRRGKLMEEAVRLANEHRIPTSFDKAPPSLPKLLDEVLARTIEIWRWASYNADQIPEDEFWVEGFDSDDNKVTEPNKWFQLEQASRIEAFEMLSTMTSLDIDDRRVRIEEFQLEVLGRALRAAARDSGLTTEQQQALGIQLRRHIAIIEGNDPNIVPTPAQTASPTRRTDAKIKELEAPLVEETHDGSGPPIG